MTSYREILKQSWKISWKNKALWFFGIFASLASFGSELKIFYRAISPTSSLGFVNDLTVFVKTGILSKEAWLNFLSLSKAEPKSFSFLILILLIILALSLFFVWLSTTSQISIINASKDLAKTDKKKVTIKNLLVKSRKKFWPVLWMNILVSLIVGVITILIGTLLVVIAPQNNAVAATLTYGLLFIVFIPFVLSISFIIKYAIAYIVIDNKKTITALNLAWDLFRKNWLISIEMAITLFFINIVAMIVISLSTLIVFFLLVSVAMAITTIMLSSKAFFFVILLLAFIVSFVAITIGKAILTSFQVVSWTSLFTNLKNKKASSKLERVFSEKPDKKK